MRKNSLAITACYTIFCSILSQSDYNVNIHVILSLSQIRLLHLLCLEIWAENLPSDHELMRVPVGVSICKNTQLTRKWPRKTLNHIIGRNLVIKTLEE